MAASPNTTRLVTAEGRNKALHRNGRLCLSPAEAAGQLGICKNHVYKYLDSGELRSFKLGQRRLINREALDEFRLKLEKKHTAEMAGEAA